MRQWTIHNSTLGLRTGDLTQAAEQAIVNAANSRLAGGGGVDGAIHQAAGLADLQRACQAIIAEFGSLPAGEAVITPGFALAAKWIIHTVGPIWRGGDRDEPAILTNAYMNCLKLAQEHGIETVAFPAISCGVYGYPVQLAAPVALSALKAGLEQGLVREAWMVFRTEESMRPWLEAAETLL